jgi:hypothetical protein
VHLNTADVVRGNERPPSRIDLRIIGQQRHGTFDSSRPWAAS